MSDFVKEGKGSVAGTQDQKMVLGAGQQLPVAASCLVGLLLACQRHTDSDPQANLLAFCMQVVDRQ